MHEEEDSTPPEVCLSPSSPVFPTGMRQRAHFIDSEGYHHSCDQSWWMIGGNVGSEHL